MADPCAIVSSVSDRDGIPLDHARRLDEPLAAAACAGPVGIERADVIASIARAVGMVEVRPGVGRFELFADDPLWVAVDGHLVPTPLDLPSGPHLVQVGHLGAEAASAAGIIVIEPDTTETWVVHPGKDGAAFDVFDLVTGSPAPADPLPSARPGIAAQAALAAPRWHTTILIRGLDAPPSTPPRPEIRKGRVAALGIPAGLALMAAGGAVAWNEHEGSAPLLIGGSALVLASSAAQRGVLTHQGLAPRNEASVAGFGLLGGSIAFGGLTADGSSWGGLAAGLAASAGLAQWVSNEHAIATRVPVAR